MQKTDDVPGGDDLRNLLALLVLFLPGALPAMEMGDGAQMLELHFGADVNAGKRFGDSATPSAFSLGVVDTMIHGRLSREFSVLAEIVYEDGGGEFGFDVERLMLTYAPRSWFQLSAGRFHTPLGYWNTAYHHARWMYATTEAPLLAQFEDEAGPLPMHTIGVLLHGMAPLGAVHLEYDLAVGNGRGPEPDPPQNFADVNDSKSVCAALHAELKGFRLGISGMLDSSTLASGATLDEWIAVADLHWQFADIEAIAEGALVHHDVAGVTALNYGAYGQLSWGFRDDFHLYGRVERFVRDAAESFLLTPTASIAVGGLRYELTSTAALKLEGGWERINGVEATTARGQLAWLF